VDQHVATAQQLPASFLGLDQLAGLASGKVRPGDLAGRRRVRVRAEQARNGVGLIGLYVTVTVTDPAQLGRAVADTEACAEFSRIQLRRLYRSQAAGFSATLPCGICLPELAARLRH
jgi:hypothetical protein